MHVYQGPMYGLSPTFTLEILPAPTFPSLLSPPPLPSLLLLPSLLALSVPSKILRLCDLRKTNPALHEALMQMSVTDLPAVDAEEEAYTTCEVYDDCDIPLDVVSDLLRSGGSSVASNSTVSDDGGIARYGNAEASNAEDGEGPVDAAPPALGRGQRKKIAARRYLGPVWEEH
ncbi:hypothetical protein C8R45DRAFT_1143598 [Mycena sanguinolenta]|nr:hypothetical protein C8R45DRAFT_1143598 [Mycena sanguinolenta]